MWQRGEGNMPLNVFNSTTVYLRNGFKKKRWGRSGKGRKKDAILVLTLFCVEGKFGRMCTLTVVITWVLLLTCLIVAVSLCCRYGMSFFDLKFLEKKKWLFIWTCMVTITKINKYYLLYYWCVCGQWTPTKKGFNHGKNILFFFLLASQVWSSAWLLRHHRQWW